MTDKHTRLIEISSDNQNAVEQVINQLHKEVSEAKRYGVTLSIRRVDKSELEEFEGGFE